MELSEKNTGGRDHPNQAMNPSISTKYVRKMRAFISTCRGVCFVPFLIVFGGLFLSVLIFIYAEKRQADRIESIFIDCTQETAERLREQIGYNLQQIQSLAEFYTSGEFVSRSEFHRFIRTFRRSSSVQAFEWIPCVKDQDRPAYEAAAREDGFADFRITQHNRDFQLEVAGRREEYFPVYYVEPCEGNEAALGFDLSSNPALNEALMRSRDTGQIITTERIAIEGEGEKQFGFLVFSPVYNYSVVLDTVEQRRQNLRGFVLAKIQVGALLEDSLRTEPTQGIDFYIFDEDASGKDRFLYFHPSRSRVKAVEPLVYDELVKAAGLQKAETIDLCGRKWILIDVPTPAFFDKHQTSQPLQLFLSGLLISGLVAAYVLVNGNHIARIRHVNANLLQTKDTLEREISERKQMQEQLADSHRLLQRIIDLLPIRVFWKDTNLRYLGCNKLFANDAGYDYPEDMIGMDDFQMTWQEQAELYRDDDRSVIESGQSRLNFEEPQTTPNGDTIWLKTSKVLLEDTNGEITGVLGTYEDITDRKQADEDLRGSEERFRILTETSPVGIFQTDTDGNCLFVNDRWCHIAGMSPDKAAEQGWVEGLHPDDRDRVFQAWNAFVKEGNEFALEYRFQTPEGVITWVDGHAVKMLNPQGQMIGFIGTISEITERKRAQKKIEDSEEKFRKLFEGAMDAIFWADAETGILLDCNEAASRLMRKPKSEIIGQHHKMLYPETEMGEELSPDFKNSLAVGENATLETRIITKDGQIRDVVIKSNMIENNDRKILQGIFVDVTNDKQTREQLRWAKEKAEEANIAKSQFLANMSHELRTPMNSVIGFSDLLSSEDLTDEQRDYVDMISSNSKHLLTLLSDILDYSKIEARKLDIEIIECSLDTLLSKVNSLSALKAEEKNIEYRINKYRDLPSCIQTDPTRLTQCLVNLVSNAIKFTEAGHVYVNVLSEDRDGQKFIRFDIEDTGLGIPEDMQEKIFGSFIQADGSTSRKYGGTGLGLTITKKLIELLGGHIAVSSQVGKGSVFTLTIPEVTQMPQPANIAQADQTCGDSFAAGD